MRPSLHVPGHARQAERLSPRFRSLQVAFEARRLELQANAQNRDPDLVVVFETVGAVNDFISSAVATTKQSRSLVEIRDKAQTEWFPLHSVGHGHKLIVALG